MNREPKMESSSSKGDPVLPEDVIVEIFSRLPVKILMRFKCVCKSWYNIISSPGPDFVSKHLQNYYHNPKNDDGRLLICHYNWPDDVNALFLDPTLEDFSYQHLDTPLPVYVILGPCNGIFFLQFEISATQALWNPATKECRVLPPCPPMHSDNPLCGKNCSESHGFGFDHGSNGFNVVIIRQGFPDHNLSCSEHSGRFLSEGLVYSSYSNSWIQFDLHLPGQFWVEENNCYLYLNGVYYWSASEIGNSINDLLVSYDMSSNSFNLVVHGPKSDDEHTSSDGLVIYHNTIAWVKSDVGGHCFNLWLLDQDKNSCCWTKQLVIGPFPETYWPVGYWKNDQLILCSLECCWKSGVQGFEMIQKLRLYDPCSATLETRNFGIVLNRFKIALIYKESFVSINGEKCSPRDLPPD